MDISTTPKQVVPSWEELHAMILATSEQIKENGRQMEESNQELKAYLRESNRELKALFKETDAKFKETDAKFKETDAKFKETEAIIKKNSEQIAETNKLYGGFTNEFGQMVESLCKPAALALFKKEGIGIDHIYEGPRHGRRGEEEIEVDALLCNKTAAVAVEAKTTCFKKDIDYFLKQMKNFKKIFHEFEGKTVYVAIAAMRYANGSDTYARRKGLYVLSPLSDGMFTLDKPKDRKSY